MKRDTSLPEAYVVNGDKKDLWIAYVAEYDAAGLGVERRSVQADGQSHDQKLPHECGLDNRRG